MIGGDQGQNNFGYIPGPERRAGPRKKIDNNNELCICSYLSSTPHDGNNCFLNKIKKDIRVVIWRN